MTDQPTDQQKADLLKGWEALTPKRKYELLELMTFFLEAEKPSFKDASRDRDEAYRVQLAKVHSLKNRLEAVSSKTRAALAVRLPATEGHLMAWHETLIFLIFAAEYKPFYLYEEGGKALHLAEQAIKAAGRDLAKLERGKA